MMDLAIVNRPTRAGLAMDIRDFLTKPQKELPSKCLYDQIGSALFEVVTLLPEYGLSRAEERILSRYADEIVAQLQRPITVVELGSGSGKKTRWILESLSRGQSTRYYPIDISAAALTRSHSELGKIPFVSIVGFERDYLDGLREVVARRQSGDQLLVLFLGSTVGNFDRPAAEVFLSEVRRHLAVGDALLLATDLEKPIRQLELAYDDPLGVTSAFNLNILAAINRDLDADFDLAKFEHLAPYNAQERRIEMHLRSRISHSVEIRGAGLTVAFGAGETIWTESCHKFDRREVWEMAPRAGFHSKAQWVDPEWLFAETLWVAN
jgi:dimethylhistidine N-methyltransferase